MEKNLKKNIYVYMYNWITLLYTWNIVNQLYFNKKRKNIYIIKTYANKKCLGRVYYGLV